MSLSSTYWKIKSSFSKDVEQDFRQIQVYYNFYTLFLVCIYKPSFAIWLLVHFHFQKYSGINLA
jgi:hypothetical protein